MKLYLSTIAVATVIISALNIFFGVAAWYYVIIAVIWCAALQFILDSTVALLIKISPDRWWGIDNPLFNVSDRSKRFYKAIKVRHWKDKVWELGGLGGFSKKRLEKPNDPDYVKKFIIECNKGVITHRLSYPIGFLAMLTLSGLPSLTVALPVAAVNLFLNVLPTIVLRYNTPKLKSKLTLLNRRSKSNAQDIKHLESNF